ncbi:MAG: hypothetical protein DCC65_12750 [Planctomycetota bacterium]|nr:MAG: hypothetical protein DCC65_12750 [Planctomycetota bacterium]
MLVCGLTAASLAEQPRLARGPEVYATWVFAGGAVNVTLDPAALAAVGIQLAGNSDTTLTLPIQSEGTNYALTFVNDEPSSASGTVVSRGDTLSVRLPDRDDVARIGNFAVVVTGRSMSIVDGANVQRELFTSGPAGVISDFNANDQSLTLVAELVVSPAFAAEVLGNIDLAGQPVGSLEVVGPAQIGDYQAFPATEASPRGSGADVIVGALTGDVGTSQQPRSYGFSGSIFAYSVGTTSCNIGDVPLQWIDGVPNQHPVIGQNLYRLKTEPGTSYGRFEQVGQAWLKYGFCALQGTVCGGPCTPYCGGCCNHLGVGCSDPYTAARNGGWGDLGPKGPVNAAMGTFPDPHLFASGPTNIRGRLQAQAVDVDPDSNAGALYWVEGQYVANDDALANNKNNNCSYRRVTFLNDTNNTMNWVTGNSTVRQQPAINAWQATDPGVTLVTIDIPSDGRMILGYRVTDIGGGMWHYEYALFNMNSDRAGQFFSVAAPECSGISNVGFHDVPYHSGEVIDGTDWPATILSDQVIWTTTQTYAQNQNANALRWGTMYNFRFDAPSAPTSGNIKIGLFKPGSPSLMTVTAQVPSLGVTCVKGDVNLDTIVDGLDVAKFVELLISGGGTTVEKCAGDCEFVKDCGIDMDDVANFADCLINGGC